ncbi:MAG: pyridoxamine 5'-phosphate oxidase family protein [Planctomycetota bacterium]|jgi:nitroimidazol reductase NimA-like FMN-containing flavoprotein (pyridoxamine 5'-phosphate oxidase superfamily)
MQRKDKKINDIATIEDIIRRASVCRLGLCEGKQPYIVPLCFGYKDNALYFHSARGGKKLGILRNNNNVCFEIDIDDDLIKAEEACDWAMKYQSVIGFGKAVFIDDIESRCKAFDVIMQNYSNGSFEYPIEALKNAVIIKVEIESMTGKKSGY